MSELDESGNNNDDIEISDVDSDDSEETDTTEKINEEVFDMPSDEDIQYDDLQNNDIIIDGEDDTDFSEIVPNDILDHELDGTTDEELKEIRAKLLEDSSDENEVETFDGAIDDLSKEELQDLQNNIENDQEGVKDEKYADFENEIVNMSPKDLHDLKENLIDQQGILNGEKKDFSDEIESMTKDELRQLREQLMAEQTEDTGDDGSDDDIPKVLTLHPKRR